LRDWLPFFERKLINKKAPNSSTEKVQNFPKKSRRRNLQYSPQKAPPTINEDFPL
jgi:hypothetical protein